MGLTSTTSVSPVTKEDGRSAFDVVEQVTDNLTVFQVVDFESITVCLFREFVMCYLPVSIETGPTVTISSTTVESVDFVSFYYVKFASHVYSIIRNVEYFTILYCVIVATDHNSSAHSCMDLLRLRQKRAILSSILSVELYAKMTDCREPKQK